MIHAATQETNLSSFSISPSSVVTNHKKQEVKTFKGSVIRYFTEMGEFSTLSAEEELFLGRQIRILRLSIWKVLLSVPVTRSQVIEIISEKQDAVPFTLIELDEYFFNKSDEDVPTSLLTKAALSVTKFDADETLLHNALKYFQENVKTVKSHTLKLQKELNVLLGRLRLIKNKFITSNLRLVVSVAKKYSNGSMSLIDLVQEGNIGLIKAVERYDPELGYRFSTYAAWWIRHAVSRASADKGRTVRIPVHFIESYQQFKKVKKSLELELGREPERREIAERMGVPIKKVDKIQSYMTEGSLSLDRNINGTDTRTFMDMLEDKRFEKGLSPLIINRDALKAVFEALNEVLTDTEKDIIDKRFGLSVDTELTLREIGEQYGLSRERIRQIQEGAIKKMRKFLTEQGLI